MKTLNLAILSLATLVPHMGFAGTTENATLVEAGPQVMQDVQVTKAALEAEPNKWRADIIESAMRCRANGLPVSACGLALTSADMKIPLLREIRRCGYLDVNLIYCLTTALSEPVTRAVVAYATRARAQQIPLRAALYLDKEPVINDRVGVIEGLLRCEAAKLGFEACGFR